MAQKELTEAEIRENIRREFERWDDISVNGCSDPYWGATRSQTTIIPQGKKTLRAYVHIMIKTAGLLPAQKQ